MTVQTVLEAIAVVVNLDKRYRPKRVPEEIVEAFFTGKASEDIMDFWLKS